MNTKKTRMAPPEIVEATCPSCHEHGPHEVKKGQVAKQGGAVEGTFTCQACGHTHQGLVEVPLPVPLTLMVSDKEGQTEPMTVQVLEGEEVKVGDEFEVEEALVEVTAVELGDGVRVHKAPAQQIQTLWGKDITTVPVHFAMNVGSETRAFEAEFSPEDTIGVGDVFDLDEQEVEVKQVVTTAGRRRHGRHNVREIRRVWLKRPESERRRSGDRTRPGKRAGRSDTRGAGSRSGGGSRRGPSGGTRGGSGSRSGGGPRRGPSGGPRSGGGPRRGPSGGSSRGSRSHGGSRS